MEKLIRTKLVIVALTVVFLVVVTIAGVNAEVYTKRGEDYNLTVPCIINGTYCSNSAVCNLTFMSPYPDSDVLINNVQMENHYAYHSYNIIGDNLTENGDYMATVVCTDQSLSGSTTFKTVVNPNGERPTLEKSVISFAIFGILILLLLSTIVALFIVRNPVGRMALYWTLHLTAVATSFIIWDISYGILYQEFVGNFFRIVFFVLLIGVLPMFYLTIAWMVKYVVYSKELQGMIEAGYEQDFAEKMARIATK